MREVRPAEVKAHSVQTTFADATPFPQLLGCDATRRKSSGNPYVTRDRRPISPSSFDEIEHFQKSRILYCRHRISIIPDPTKELVRKQNMVKVHVAPEISPPQPFPVCQEGIPAKKFPVRVEDISSSTHNAKDFMTRA